MTLPTSFGLWIRQRRRLVDLTQQELADWVGCSISAIRKIEGDERRPSTAAAEKIALALEVPEAERSTFVRIARLELRIDHLASISAPASLHRAPEAPAAPAYLVPAALAGHADARGDRSPRNLPIAPTPLVGRDVEVAEIITSLLRNECRALTLLGPGGIGKTRLALAAAERLGHAFREGEIFVPLAGSDSLASLAQSLAVALGVGEFGQGDLLRHIHAFLRDKSLLLVLDSMEQLVRGGDAVLRDLLRHAPGVKLLSTSRVPLNLQGEWLFRVRGLSVPARDDSAAAASSSAVRLFLQSARRANFDFDAAEDDLLSIARICRLVDGMPLAIELAASWTPVLSCHEIAAEIARDWGFLAGAGRDLPARHRSMRAVFDHSWELLTDRERSAAQALAVFRGGVPMEGAASVAGATLAELAALVAKSLVQEDGAGRYILPDLVRQYAGERLVVSGHAAAVCGAHAVYYRALAVRAEPELYRAHQLEWFKRLDAEQDNLRVALRWFAEHDAAGGLRTSVALWWFWYVRGQWRECREWLAIFLERGGEAPASLRVAALARAGNVAWMSGDTQEAIVLAEQARRLVGECDDEASAVLTYFVLGQVATHQDAAASTRFLRRSLEIARSLNDEWGVARALFRLGVNSFDDNDMAAARGFYEEALGSFRGLGDAWGVYVTQSDLGAVSLREGDLDSAARASMESLEISLRLGFRQGIASERLGLGIVALYRGELALARSLLDEGRQGYEEIDNRRGVADAHLRLGACARWHGDLQQAERHYQAALNLCLELRFEPFASIALCGMAELALLKGSLASTRTFLVEALTMARNNDGMRHVMCMILDVAAGLAAAERQAPLAVRLAGSAATQRLRLTVTRAPMDAAEQGLLVAGLRDRLGDMDFESQWNEGASLTIEEAEQLVQRYLEHPAEVVP